MNIVQLLVGMVIWFFPLKLLRAIFFAKNQPGPIFYFSGRVALRKIGESLRGHRATIILPEYICNIVNRAFSGVNYNIISYRCNEDFDINLNEIKKIAKDNRGAILLLAPIAGAECGQSWITSAEGRGWRKDNDIFLIFDLCQDISRIYSEDFVGEVNFALLSSFNNKSFAGIMGAMVISDVVSLSPEKASWLDFWVVCKTFIFKILERPSQYLKSKFFKIKIKVANTSNVFEYSYCSTLLYNFDHDGIVRLQLSIGAAGMLMIKIYTKIKRSYINQKFLNPVNSPYWLTSCYVRLKDGGDLFRIKLPYALDGEPKKSLRPDGFLVHFKGFDDLK